MQLNSCIADLCIFLLEPWWATCVWWKIKYLLWLILHSTVSYTESVIATVWLPSFAVILIDRTCQNRLCKYKLVPIFFHCYEISLISILN